MPIIDIRPGSPDFTQIPQDPLPLIDGVKDNDSYTVIDDQTAWEEATSEHPTGAYVIGRRTYTTGQVVMAKVYHGYINSEAKISTHLNSMNLNTRISKATDQLVSRLTADTDGITYAEIKALVSDNNLHADTGMTADEFVVAATGATAGASYSASRTQDLIASANKYSQGKLTDNVVLQEKLTVLTSNRAAAMEYLSNIQKAWNEFLNQLTRRI